MGSSVTFPKDDKARQEEVGRLKHISERDQSGIAERETMMPERWKTKKERPRVKPDRLGNELSAIEKRMFEEGKEMEEIERKRIAIRELHDKDMEEVDRKRMESLERLSAEQYRARRKYMTRLKELSAKKDIARKNHRESLEELSAKQDIAISELHDIEMEEIERKHMEILEELTAKQDIARRKHMTSLKELSTKQNIAISEQHGKEMEEIERKRIAIRELRKEMEEIERKRIAIRELHDKEMEAIERKRMESLEELSAKQNIARRKHMKSLKELSAKQDLAISEQLKRGTIGKVTTEDQSNVLCSGHPLDLFSARRLTPPWRRMKTFVKPALDLPDSDSGKRATKGKVTTEDQSNVLFFNPPMDRFSARPVTPPWRRMKKFVKPALDLPDSDSGENQGTLPIRQPPELGIHNKGTGVLHSENIESPISMNFTNESLTDKTQEPNGFSSELFAEYETISKPNESTKGENKSQEDCDESVTHKSENKTENSPKEFGKSHDETDDLLTETSESQDKIDKSQYETYELLTETGELQGGIGKLQDKTDELLAERGESHKEISKLQDETDELLVENGESQDGIDISQDETDEHLTEPGQPLEGIGYQERDSTTPLNPPVGDQNTPVSFNIDVPTDDDAPVVFLYLQEEDKNLVKSELCTEGDHIPKIGDSCKIISKLYHLLPHGCRFRDPIHVKIKLDKRCQQDTNNTVVFYSATAPNEKPHWEMLTNNNKSYPERRIVCADSETCTISMPTFCVLCVGECDQNESLRLIQTSQFDVYVGMRFEADHIVEGDTQKWLVKIRVFLSRNGAPIAGVHDWQTFPVVKKPIKGIQFGCVQIRVHDVKQDWTLDQEYNSEDRSVFQIETGKRSKAVFTYTCNNANSMDTFRAKVRLHQENARNDCELVLEDDCILGNLITNTVRLQTTGLGSTMGQQLNGVVNGLGASNTSTVNGAGANNNVSTATQGAAANISNSEVNSLRTAGIRISFHKAFKAISDAVDRFPTDAGELEKLCRLLRVDRSSVVHKAADRCTSPSLLALLEWKDNTGGNLGTLENLFREYVDR